MFLLKRETVASMASQQGDIWTQRISANNSVEANKTAEAMVNVDL